MTVQLQALCFDAYDPVALAAFWAGVLGWDRTEATTLRSVDDTGFSIRFASTDESRTGPNQMHFDLTSTSREDQQQTVDRALGLGARHLDVGQRPEERHDVLADPEGNEFCVLGPDNAFLAECGFLGALASDGSQAVGYFWSQALGWPLVWDQDEETAIRSPRGGPKITWGGPPLAPRTGRTRLHFDLGLPDAADRHTEADRLVSLGATVVGQADEGRMVLADPDGNEFTVTG